MSKSSPVPYFQTMSPVPPEPQPSNPPPSLASERQQQQDNGTRPTTTKTTTSSKFPKPKLRLELRDLEHDSTDVFLRNFNSAKDFTQLVGTVLRGLYTVADDDDVSISRPTPSHKQIPGTRSVTLILRDMEGVAYTTGIDLDDDHKEIHLSLSYLKHVESRNKSYPARTEILGVVCHELVHCFQWNALGTAPGGLIEGIADWIRLNAGFVPPHWKKEANGDWDAGYQATAYFLDWIEKTRGKGSIYKLNQALCGKKYKQETFWMDLFQKSVEGLWKDYALSLKDENEKDKPSRYGDPNKKMEIRVKKDDAQDGATEETAEDGNDH